VQSHVYFAARLFPLTEGEHLRVMKRWPVAERIYYGFMIPQIQWRWVHGAN
jgi:hypothetical protein